MFQAPDQLQALLRLQMLPGIGSRRMSQLLAAFASPVAALQAPASAWRALGMPREACEQRRASDLREAIDATMAWLEAPHHHLLCLGDEAYPALLAEIDDAPFLLMAEGDLACLQQPALAMVGSRNASKTGARCAHDFAATLAGAGMVVVSGLARGIDTAAHQGALAGGGKTVAVLGTGVGHIYPATNQALAQQIVAQGGVLLSELPLACAPVASNFPRRNRIISGLSVGTLVVEAGLNSGSLITAKLAAEQNREVFAIPGSIQHPGSKGCHQLLREGAVLVEQVQDIFAQLQGWQSSEPAKPMQADLLAGTPRQQQVLRELRAQAQSSDQLCQLLAWPLHEVLAELTELELCGAIAQQGGHWQVVR